MTNEEKTAFEIYEEVSPTRFEMDEKDEILLQDTVRSLLKEDVRSLSLVRELCKTNVTFQNSLGNLYLFLKDENICRNCPNKITSCKKEKKGFRYHLAYDKDRDEIKVELKECNLKKEKDEILNRIRPCECSKEQCLREFNSFFEFFISHKKENPLQEVLNLFVRAKNIFSSFSSDSKYTGYSIFCINDIPLSIKINMAICYMSAKSGLTTSYVNLSSLFYDLNSKDYSTKQNALKDFRMICSCQSLFIENMNLLGSFDVPFYDEFLFTLLKKRDEKGKITFCSVSSSYPLDKVIYGKMKESEHLKEATGIIDSSFEKKNLKVFDVR